MFWHGLIETAATARLAEVMKSGAVRAEDAPAALSGRDDASRIMLLGGGLTSGWGVRAHGLALAGSLQRSMYRRLEQHVDVFTVSSFGIEIAGAVDLLRRQEREDIDAIVVVFGASDALRYTPSRIWRQELERLMAELDARSDGGPSIPIVVAGIPPLDSLAAFRSVLTPVLRLHAEGLNAITRQVVQRNRRAVFAPLPAMAAGDHRPHGSPAAYETWAEAIAAPLAAAMPRGVTRVGDTALLGGSVPRGVAEVLDPRDRRLREQLQHLAATLQGSLGADFAAINLTDGDRLWTVADSSGTDARSAPLASTYCATTVRQGHLHVPDSAVDPRFADLDLARVYQLRSYAGAVVRDARGAVAGTVCVFNGAVSGRVDLEQLRLAAVRVEDLLGLPDPADRLRPPLEPLRAAPELLGPAVLPVVAPDSRAATRPVRRRLGGIGARLTAPAYVASRGAGLARVADWHVAPVEKPFAIAGPRPIRVLLVGGDAAVGFGAETRADAIDGALARLLHARTGRGVVVENRARHLVRLHELVSSLGPLGTADFDVVVWAPTYLEATRSVTALPWRRGLGAMLETIGRGSDASVVLLGFPPLLGAQPLAVAARARAAQLNRLLRGIAAQHRRVLAVEPPPVRLDEVETATGAEVYRDVAVRLLPTVLELLDDEPEAPVEAERRSSTEFVPA